MNELVEYKLIEGLFYMFRILIGAAVGFALLVGVYVVTVYGIEYYRRFVKRLSRKP